MITRVESYNTQQNINFKGKPSPELIKEIKEVGAKRMQSIVADASKKGVAVSEDSLKDVQKWVNSMIRSITKYMKGFHEDITLDCINNNYRWWIFENKNLKAHTSYNIDWSIDKYSLDKTKGRNIGWIMEYIKPEMIHHSLLQDLMGTARATAKNGNGTVADVKGAIDNVSRWAHQIKDPSGYKKNFKPIVDKLRRERAAQIKANATYDKFFKINRAIYEPYSRQLETLIDFNKNYPTYYFANTGSREVWHMAEAAINARKKLPKADLEKYVAQMRENINSMDDYIKSFSKHIYIDRDEKLPNAPWEFRMSGHYGEKPISVKKPVTPKPERELFINTVTEDIKELRLNNPEDIEKELFNACVQRGFEKTEKSYTQSFAEYQDSNIVLLNQMKELAKRTHQEAQYEKFLNDVQAIYAPKDAIKATQAANESLLAKYTKGLGK